MITKLNKKIFDKYNKQLFISILFETAKPRHSLQDQTIYALTLNIDTPPIALVPIPPCRDIFAL